MEIKTIDMTDSYDPPENSALKAFNNWLDTELIRDRGCEFYPKCINGNISCPLPILACDNPASFRKARRDKAIAQAFYRNGRDFEWTAKIFKVTAKKVRRVTRGKYMRRVENILTPNECCGIIDN